MLNTINLFYFSPTGGTLEVAKTFCNSISTNICYANLSMADISKEYICSMTENDSDLTVIAAPVFAGRIPKLVSDRLAMINGEGKPAVIIAVYGNRAYEDALIELSDIAKSLNFNVIAAGAFVAQHSLSPNVANGRPDITDIKEIKDFGHAVASKLNTRVSSPLIIPGNHPYKERKKMQATPFSLASCTKCKMCITLCPTTAITFENNEIKTSLEKCILCAACVAKCPKNARTIPAKSKEHTKEVLAKCVDIRNKNEVFI